jgi:hypothetical protein
MVDERQARDREARLVKPPSEPSLHSNGLSYARRPPLRGAVPRGKARLSRLTLALSLHFYPRIAVRHVGGGPDTSVGEALGAFSRRSDTVPKDCIPGCARGVLGVFGFRLTRGLPVLWLTSGRPSVVAGHGGATVELLSFSPRPLDVVSSPGQSAHCPRRHVGRAGVGPLTASAQRQAGAAARTTSALAEKPQEGDQSSCKKTSRMAEPLVRRPKLPPKR